VDRLLKVKDLLYTHGFTIAGARKKLRDVGAEPPTEGETRAAGVARAALFELRREIEGMLAEIELIAAPAGASAAAPRTL
jgi:hypothetical protein